MPWRRAVAPIALMPPSREVAAPRGRGTPSFTRSPLLVLNASTADISSAWMMPRLQQRQQQWRQQRWRLRRRRRRRRLRRLRQRLRVSHPLAVATRPRRRLHRHCLPLCAPLCACSQLRRASSRRLQPAVDVATRWYLTVQEARAGEVGGRWRLGEGTCQWMPSWRVHASMHAASLNSSTP